MELRVLWAVIPTLTLSLIAPLRADDLAWDKGTNGGFVTSLIRDARGGLWAGTEDNGVAQFREGKWQSFGVQDGLGDANAYAMVGDRLGRVWVGHLNHGVSVWNGQAWKNFGVTQGPLGERVFALAASPVDGDVWMATNAGLTRYSLSRDTWTHYTRATGLPTVEISALAFDSLGRLYVGTQCEGLLISGLEDDFASWKQIRGATSLPLNAGGTGLPSNFINDVLVADDDTIYVATNTGLARSKDAGASWTYVRGADWEEKVKGLWKGKPPEAMPNEGAVKELLREDYVTNLAEDERGLLWIGYRRRGYEARRPLADRATISSPERNDDGFPYVSTLVPLGNGSVALGYYSEGVQTSDPVPAFVPNRAEQEATKQRRGWKANSNPDLTVAPMPKVAGIPTAQELARLIGLLERRVPTPADASPVVALPEDWTTQGDWLGRYGRYWSVSSAMLAPKDYFWGAGREPIYFDKRIGPNATPDDGLRHWVHWLYTDNRRVLEMPAIYFHSRLEKGLTPWEKDLSKQKYRRQSEWDDHGEEYPLSKDGPHVFVTLKIPNGNYMLSLYNHNKDGHDGFNRARDYKVSIRRHDVEKRLGDISDFDQQPEFALGRQRDFWGGVWKRYLVKGSREITLQMNRNYSYNTILAGMFLDEVTEEPEPYFDAPQAGAKDAEWFPSANVKVPEDDVVETMWRALVKAKADDVGWWAGEGRLFYQALLRYHQPSLTRTASGQTPALWNRLGTCYYNLGLFPQWEQMQEKRGLKTARSIEKALVWDGKSDFSGKGRATITAFRASKEK